VALRDVLLQHLRTLPPDVGLEERGGNAWMICQNPEHAKESTASFKISLEPPYTGHGHCFGCGWSGPWERVAKLLGLKGGAEWLVEDVANQTISDEEFSEMLGETVRKDVRLDYEVWPEEHDWRGVSGRLVAAVGGRMKLGKYPELVLPVRVMDRTVGHVTCKVKKARELNYINSRGTWAHDALYPYDYIERLGRIRTLLLVEGSRDALMTIQNGWPALALLGAKNWTDVCKSLVLQLEPETVVLLMDPDDAGYAAAEAVYAALHEHVHVRVFWLPSKVVKVTKDGVEKEKRVKLADPADLNPRQLDGAMARLGLRRTKYAWPHIATKEKQHGGRVKSEDREAARRVDARRDARRARVRKLPVGRGDGPADRL